MNGVIEKIKNTVEHHGLIDRGDNLVIGFSGGPDSTCLVQSMYALKEYFGINRIAAVHINHMYRGEDAYRDEKFSEEFCRERGILFFAQRYDVEKMAREQKMSAEEMGRKLRYGAFAQAAEKLGGAKIAVAHNRQDQAETLLMRLARGTGTEGLCGIEYSREGGIIRPLLDCDRNEIEKYCESENLMPRTDLTNLQPIYTRNVVRLKLIPYINETMGCDIVKSLAALSDIAKEDKDFISGFVDEAMKGFCVSDGRGEISRTLIKNLHPAVRKRVVSRCFAQIGLLNDIGSVHLEAAEQLLISEKTTADLEFPHKYVMKCRYDKVFFEKVHQKDTIEYKIDCKIINKEELPPEIAGAITDRRNLKYLKYQLFDYDKIEKAAGEVVLRYRKAGDAISPVGFNGTKKLKEYFIDKKIDRDLRDRIPLVCVGSKVLWIYGYDVNGKFIADESSRRILMVKMLK